MKPHYAKPRRHSLNAQERPRDLPASDVELRERMAEQVEALRGRGFEAIGDVVKRVVASVPK